MLDIQLEQVLPSQIEHRSFELIQQELDHMGTRSNSGNELVIKHAIHTTADFEYADNLVSSNHAVKKGTEASKQGAVIITDINMGKSRINKRAAPVLGAEVLCFMAGEDIVREAEERKCARAVADMEKAVRLFGTSEGTCPCIFAIGNALIALIRLYELVREGRIRPSLATGAPVGFVNVMQSKEPVLTLKDIPYTAARGRKRDSNVAAVICNTLLHQIK